jgi:hypothetical protein
LTNITSFLLHERLKSCDLVPKNLAIAFKRPRLSAVNF